MREEKRCPECGALVMEGAEWCGQCLAPLGATPASTIEEPPALDALDDTPELVVAPGEQTEPRAAQTPYWACPVCDHENPLDSVVCSVCGTPFARLFDEAPQRPNLPPGSAAVAGLVPGVGHLRCGRAGDGIARVFFFLGSLSLVALFGFSSDAGGVSVALTLIFVLMVLFSIGESCYDAYRLASGERELVSSRTLLWVFVGVFGLAVALVVFLSLGQTPRPGAMGP